MKTNILLKLISGIGYGLVVQSALSVLHPVIKYFLAPLENGFGLGDNGPFAQLDKFAFGIG